MPERLSWQRSEPVVPLKQDRRDRTPFWGNGQPGLSQKKPHRFTHAAGRRFRQTEFLWRRARQILPAGPLTMRQGRPDRLFRGAPLAGQHSSRTPREARGGRKTQFTALGLADWRMLFIRRTVSREHAQVCFHTVQGIVVQGRSQCFLDDVRPPFLSRVFPCGSVRRPLSAVVLRMALLPLPVCSTRKGRILPPKERGRPVSGTQEQTVPEACQIALPYGHIPGGKSGDAGSPWGGVAKPTCDAASCTRWQLKAE